MSRRALIEHRPWLLASLVAATSYFFLADETVPGLYAMVWKGLGVGFLALYALLRGRGGVDGTLIALAMALCATADMVLEFSFLAGGAIFAVGHVVAIWLYLRNRRADPVVSQRLAGLALLIVTPVLAALLTYPLANWQMASAYALVVGAMAAAAWTSRFPRYRVGLGAVLFVVSDLVIFAREAGRMDPDLAGWLVWPLYYAGQLMIVTGVVQTLRRDRAGSTHRG